MLERSLEEGGRGAQANRLGDGHPGMDAELAGAVGGGLHHPPLVAPAAHDQQVHVSELGVAVAADLDEEGVEVYVHDAGGHMCKVAQAPSGAPAPRVD